MSNESSERERRLNQINKFRDRKGEITQISMKYRGSFVFAFSVMFSLFRIFFLEAVMNGFL